MSTGSIILTSLAALVTLLAVTAATIYFAGYADDVAEWWAKRYYKAKAITEMKVMEHAGSEQVEGMMKGVLDCSFLWSAHTSVSYAICHPRMS
jgi:hypothetical protein